MFLVRVRHVPHDTQSRTKALSQTSASPTSPLAEQSAQFVIAEVNVPNLCSFSGGATRSTWHFASASNARSFLTADAMSSMCRV